MRQKAIDADYTLSKLRGARKSELKKHFDDNEIVQIQELLQRRPIPESVVLQLVEKCDWSCCICWNIDDHKPVVLHHIREHASGGDDTYENLVVLCLNHHGQAHSKWEISRHPVPPDFIRQRKGELEKAVAEFREGIRVAPGREGVASTPEFMTDVKALQKIADFLNRPAVLRPFEIEGNMADFLSEMSNVILALNAGPLQTRDGYTLGANKPILSFSNPNWRERMVLVRDQFDTLRARVEVAIREGELVVRDNGVYYFENRDLPKEVDAMRHVAVATLNTVLHQAGLNPIQGPNSDLYRW